MSGPYQRSAEVYDRMYGDKSFVDEAATIRAMVDRARPGARTLLDVGCGTGGHLACTADCSSIATTSRSPVSA